MANKPGEMALVAMKKLDKAIVPFKVPAAPAPKKFQMKILTEEQYIEVSAQFISRSISYTQCFLFTLNSILILVGNGKNYPERFLPGFGEIKGTSCIFRCAGEKRCGQIKTDLCQIQWP